MAQVFARVASRIRLPCGAWLSRSSWNRERSYKRTVVAGVGGVQAWVEVLDVSSDLVLFRWTFVFESDGAVLTSESTL